MQVYLPLKGEHRHVVAQVFYPEGCHPATCLMLLGQRVGALERHIMLVQNAVGYQPHQQAQQMVGSEGR